MERYGPTTRNGAIAVSHLDHPSIHESLMRLREEELARKALHHKQPFGRQRPAVFQSRAVSLLLRRAGAPERGAAHTVHASAPR